MYQLTEPQRSTSCIQDVPAVFRPSCLSLLLLVAAGCGEVDGLIRVEVSGTVLQEGQPVTSGSVIFTPDEGIKGPRVVTGIEKGQFQVPASRGPVVGPHIVSIQLGPLEAGAGGILAPEAADRSGGLGGDGTPRAVALPTALPPPIEFKETITATGPNEFTFKVE